MNNEVKIGLDLDGVLITDMNMVADVDTFLKIRRDYPRVNFKPWFPFYIVTGRLYTDLPDTIRWIHNAEINPCGIFCDNDDLSDPVSYKASVLNSQNFRVFIESSEEQAAALVDLCPNTQIYTFRHAIEYGFRNIIYS